MKLSQILSIIKPSEVFAFKDVEILGLSEDSRTVEKRFLFFARKGSKVSGWDYVSEAVQKGVSAVITEEPTLRNDLPVPLIRVSSIQENQPKIADLFYGHPSGDLTIVGITGTNGKTTFTYLLESIAREMGWRVGVIGTVNYRIPKKDSEGTEILDAPNTTPNALELQKLLSIFRERGTDLVIVEVSSHALALGRTSFIEFDGAVFTNLTQDHLDFHKTMDDYFDAKSILFKTMSKEKKVRQPTFVSKVLCDKFSIINVDDLYGRKMIQTSSVPVVGYGIHPENLADFVAKEILLNSAGSCFYLSSPEGDIQVKTKLIGQYNVYNSLASVAAAVKLGIPLSVIVRGLEKVNTVPGRLEPVDCGQNFTVLVDYAHTEDALKNVLNSIRQFAKKKVLTLFGCGGDRDRSKRPLMGATAATLSDWVIVTSDNPRSEDPQKITLDIEVGIRRVDKTNYEIILEREKAIEKILKIACEGDVVLIAGKGHETYQIFADRIVHSDDREIVRKILCSH